MTVALARTFLATARLLFESPSTTHREHKDVVEALTFLTVDAIAIQGLKESKRSEQLLSKSVCPLG